MVFILSEGTFHRFQCGVLTNIPMAEHPWPAIQEEYMLIRGKPFERPTKLRSCLARSHPMCDSFWLGIRVCSHNVISIIAGRAGPVEERGDAEAQTGRKSQELRRVSRGRLCKPVFGQCGLAPLAVQHYVVVGERKGFRPHPLFDPVMFRMNAGASVKSDECALIAYIERFAGTNVTPSIEFEQAWYKWQNPDWPHTFTHPFLHCAKFGLLQGRDPAPCIDLQKLSQTWGLVGADLVTRMYTEINTHGRLPPTYASYTIEELRANQDAFRGAIQIQKLIDRRRVKRDFLVFVQADLAFDRGFLHEAREFDVLLNYYGGSPEAVPAGVDIAISQRGTKTTAIDKLLNSESQLLLEYDAVLFLDNDIALGARDIERLFATMREHELDLAQASLSAESDCVWPVFKQPNVGDGVRRVNSAEIMMPCLSRRALVKVGWAFSESVSGFGVDLLLGHGMAQQGIVRAAVIGSVVAHHEKKIDEKGGEFYSFMRRSNINPKLELWFIMNRYGVKPSFDYL